MHDTHPPTLPTPAGLIELGEQVLLPLTDRNILQTLDRNNPFYHPEPFGEGTLRWTGASLSYGDCGLALALHQLHQLRPAAELERAWHGSLRSALQDLKQNQRCSLSLYGKASVPAVAHVLRITQAGEKGYQQALDALHRWILHRGKPWLTRMPLEGGMHWSTYDLIEGATGLGRYLLMASTHCSEAHDLLKLLLDKITHWATCPSSAFCTQKSMGVVLHRLQDPSSDGYIVCGLAHGVAGPLALMALAHLQGITVPGQIQGMQQLAEWLQNASKPTPYGPDQMCFVDASGKDLMPGHLTRTAWCHGNPGIARAFQLTAQALSDEHLLQHSVQLMQSALQRPRGVQEIDSPTLCHGLAGLYHLSRRFRADLDHSPDWLEEAVQHMAVDLCRQKDQSKPLLYQEHNPLAGAFDHAGFLQGASGIALALISQDLSRVEWDQTLLLV